LAGERFKIENNTEHIQTNTIMKKILLILISFLFYQCKFKMLDPMVDNKIEREIKHAVFWCRTRRRIGICIRSYADGGATVEVI
jgi:hypothetical protein